MRELSREQRTESRVRSFVLLCPELCALSPSFTGGKF